MWQTARCGLDEMSLPWSCGWPADCSQGRQAAQPPSAAQPCVLAFAVPLPVAAHSCTSSVVAIAGRHGWWALPRLPNPPPTSDRDVKGACDPHPDSEPAGRLPCGRRRSTPDHEAPGKWCGATALWLWRRHSGPMSNRFGFGGCPESAALFIQHRIQDRKLLTHACYHVLLAHAIIIGHNDRTHIQAGNLVPDDSLAPSPSGRRLG